jgi:hypothetical protein
MRTVIAATFLLLAASPAGAECRIFDIETALASSLDGLKKLERDVSEFQSTEGGVWEIYREADGRVHTIIRIDAGESGRLERRLSVVNRKTYGIAVTRIDYLRHAFAEEAGPNGTAARKTDYYYYCDGALYVPPEGFAMLDIAAYSKAGKEAAAALVKDKDVADFTKGLAKSE